MTISGFTIVRNALKFNYPVVESINSILPICDEFIVNVGDSEDETLKLIASIQSPKIKIIETKWDFAMGKEVLSYQTNLALKECKSDWAFYLQSDEVIHEDDLSRIQKVLEKCSARQDIDAIRFQWLHFFGSYFRYRIDAGWYQKQDRIIRNNGQIESYGDAYAFKRKDDQPLRRKNTPYLLYHYGWVHPENVMTERRLNAEKIGFTALKEEERKSEFSYGDLDRFPVYFGSHPQVMEERIKNHTLSQKDRTSIGKKCWWRFCKILKLRYKTHKRIKYRIE